MKNEIITCFSPFIISSCRVRFGLFIFFLTFSEKQAAISETFCIFAQILLFGIKMLNLNRTDGKETNKRTIEPTWVSPRW